MRFPTLVPWLLALTVCSASLRRPQAVMWRKSGTWQYTHADSALVESGGRRFVMVAIARSPEGGEWLRRLAAPLHDLIVPAGAARLALDRQ
jgi:beta-lactamase class A